MSELTLTPEQTIWLSKAHGPVTVKDAEGNLIGRLEREYPQEEIAGLIREASSAGPWFTGNQVQSHLQALQAEWDRSGGFDEAYMHAFLDRLEKEDPGQVLSVDELE